MGRTKYKTESESNLMEYYIVLHKTDKLLWPGHVKGRVIKQIQKIYYI